ncbi:MAG: class I SAM-dependent methyltransferase family protein, partial [bacterium]
NKYSSKKLLKKFFQYVWFNVDNSKAVRNRLKFVRRELKAHLHTIAGVDKEINIISIASGSSRAVIEIVNEERYLQDTKLSVTFLDKNPQAIEYSKRLAESISHPRIQLEWINDTVGNYFRSNPTKKFDVVEIVGLLDYFTDEKVIEIFKGIYGILQDGGVVITANISHNKEERFITKVIDWPMIYRTPDELARLVHEAGFSYNTMKAFYEPLKVHGLVVAKK